MPKTRKRKVPITASSHPDASSSKIPIANDYSNPASKRTRTLIRRFHVLLKRQQQLAALLPLSLGPSHTRDKLEIGNEKVKGKSRMSSVQLEMAEIEKEIDELGGLAEYQRMSAAGQSEGRGGSSAKILVEWLISKNIHTAGKERIGEGHKRLRLMDVGALRPDNYAKWNAWIECTPVDLRARVPGIIEQDFLQLDLTSAVVPEPDCTFSGGHRERWDVISLSLVLNFVPSPQDRGRMLCIAHQALRDNGRLFLALPAPCVHNSRYLTPVHLVALLKAVGFEMEEERCKKGGKMAYWLFRKVQPGGDLDGFGKKVMLRKGQDRNNFCVLLSAST